MRQRKTHDAIESGNESRLSHSFEPLLGKRMHTLILGTMPGQKSLVQQQYYAHQRNALWPIVCAMVTGEKPTYDIHQQLNYEQRCTLISNAGFALWDVLASCERPGSLDGAIVRKSEKPNPIGELIGKHPELHTIVCNGRTADALFKRHVQAQLKQPPLNTRKLAVVCMPSTSPAMASLSLDAKFLQWQAALSAAHTS